MRVLKEPFLLISYRSIDEGLLTTVSPQALRLYFLLRRYVNRTEESVKRSPREPDLLISWPSQKKLCDLLSIDKRHLIRLLNELKSANWVMVVKVGRKNLYAVGVVKFFEGSLFEVYWMDSRLGEGKHKPINLSKEKDDQKILYTKQVTRMSPIKVTNLSPIDIENSCDKEATYSDFQRTANSLEIDKVLNKKERNKQRKKNRQKQLKGSEAAPLTEEEISLPNPVKNSEEIISDEKLTKRKRLPSGWGDKKETDFSKSDNAKTLSVFYREEYRKIYKSVPTITAREMKHLADFAKWWGGKAKSFLRFAIHNWDKIAPRLRETSLAPTIPRIYFHRESINILTSSSDPWKTQGKVQKESKPKDDEGW